MLTSWQAHHGPRGHIADSTGRTLTHTPKASEEKRSAVPFPKLPGPGPAGLAFSRQEQPPHAPFASGPRLPQACDLRLRTSGPRGHSQKSPGLGRGAGCFTSGLLRPCAPRPTVRVMTGTSGSFCVSLGGRRP